ncbi:hypothetical protein VKT23_008467 [Stygiomarasmius scandens]|uniref:RRM domain-containing protein n=1 Tax=Marasmiellus scandens TaxID=2682957 RepID=A0ABR1JGH1_9AGAR
MIITSIHFWTPFALMTSRYHRFGGREDSYTRTISSQASLSEYAMSTSGRRSASPERGHNRRLPSSKYAPREWQSDTLSRDSNQADHDFREVARDERDQWELPYPSLKVHPSLHDPRRTLVICNIAPESSRDTVRIHFQAHGRIEHFEEFIRLHGTAFVTFYDIRSAQRACAKLDRFELSFQKIEVAFLRPKNNAMVSLRGHDLLTATDFKQNLRGTLIVRSTSSSSLIDDDCLRSGFEKFGAIKSVNIADEHPPASYRVDFYDLRDCLDAFSHRDKLMQEGFDLKLAWKTESNHLNEEDKVPLDVNMLLSNNVGQRPPLDSDPKERLRNAIKTQQVGHHYQMQKHVHSKSNFKLLAAFAAASRSGAFKPVSPSTTSLVSFPSVTASSSTCTLPTTAVASVLANQANPEHAQYPQQLQNSQPGHCSLSVPPLVDQPFSVGISTPAKAPVAGLNNIQELLSLVEQDKKRREQESILVSVLRNAVTSAEPPFPRMDNSSIPVNYSIHTLIPKSTSTPTTDPRLRR